MVTDWCRDEYRTCAMSEQKKEDSGETQSKAPATPIDAAAATAALAEAVASATAEKSVEQPAAPAKDAPPAAAKPALAVVAKNDAIEAKPRGGWRSYEKQAAAIAVVVGLGVISSAYAPPPAKVLEQGTPEWIAATNAGIREYRDQLVRLG